MTPEAAKQVSNKLKLDQATEETAEELTKIAEPELNEGIGTIGDRIIRYIGLPALTTFFGWLSVSVLRATAEGWASQPRWVIDLHEQIAALNLQGPLSMVAVIVGFVLFIITVMGLCGELTFKSK
jgi:hypothetical protein